MKGALALGVGILTLAALPALAADLPPRIVTKAPVMVATAYNWSGCYIGGNAGGKWASTTDDVTVAASTAFVATTAGFGRDRTSTVIGGGQIGCNVQSGNWVFGLEGDADWQRWRQTRTLSASTTVIGNPLVVPAPFVVGDTFDIRSDWQASARGRIGYAFDRTLLYVTGGAAFTNVKVGANFLAFTSVAGTVFPATAASDSKTLVGATVGGGFEYAFTNNWSFGVEGRYSWYGNQTFSAGSVAVSNVGVGAPVFVFAPATQTLRIETFEVTARLNWKFDWGGPVVARY
jgi:outer membrane immunogenic protein